MATDTQAATHDVVSRFYEAALSADLDVLSDLLHPDVVISEPPALPFGGEHAGRPAALALLQILFDAIDLDAVVIESIIAGGERAAAFLRIPFRAADGVEILVCETFVVREASIVEIRPFYFDTATILAAAG
jgi:uncharacterized protein